jgi:hypothetical protein
LSRVDLREFLLQFPEEVRQRSKMAYRSFVRRKHRSFFRSILPIHNLTTSSNNLLWISAWRSHFALRNRMTERTSLLAGLCIGAVISNTPHSNMVRHQPYPTFRPTHPLRPWGFPGKDRKPPHCYCFAPQPPYGTTSTHSGLQASKTTVDIRRDALGKRRWTLS